MSKDVQILLKEFRTDADHCGLTSAAEIMRETRNSIVVVPAAAPDTVLKIIKPTGDPNEQNTPPRASLGCGSVSFRLLKQASGSSLRAEGVC
jgi:hypothetical protein